MHQFLLSPFARDVRRVARCAGDVALLLVVGMVAAGLIRLVLGVYIWWA